MVGFSPSDGCFVSLPICRLKVCMVTMVSAVGLFSVLSVGRSNHPAGLL